MDGRGQSGTDVEYGVEGIGTETDVRHGAQVFQCMAFLLQGVLGRALTEEFHFLGINFHAALFVDGGRNDRAGDAERRAEFHAVGERIGFRKLSFVDNNLDVLERCSVVQLQKRHIFRVPRRPDPSADGDILLQVFGFCHDILDVHMFHG